MSEARATDSHEQIAAVLGRTPSGIFILTAAGPDGNETGMLASWVQQASFAPPMVTVAVNRERYLHTWLRHTTKLALSIVGESDKTLLRHFGRGFAPEEPAFDGLEVGRGVTGLPVLTSALGYLEGNITGRMDAGDHIIYLLHIVGAGVGESLKADRPRVHIRKNGFSY